MEFKTNKKRSTEEKQEIINYAKKHSVYTASRKFNVGIEAIKYWMYPEIRKKATIKNKKIYKEKLKNDPHYQKRCKEYALARKKSGEAHECYLKWWNSLSKKEQTRRRETIKQHRLDNIDHYKQRSKAKYEKEKAQGILKERRSHPIQKLKHTIREGVRRALKYAEIHKDWPSIKYLGCTVDEFKKHIEMQFQDGMTWDNHSRGENCWHLDHIKPLSLLKESSDLETIKKICHYTNYQPLWEKDNLEKQDKL